MLAIPVGGVGIIIFLQLHGIMVYGFFSVIGALGLAGVVVNDSIILLAKLEKEYPKRVNQRKPHEIIADISKTRLRAVLLTTITTVAGLLPTAYGFFGYDSMLADMMLTMAWGLIFGTVITLLLVPSLYCTMKETIQKIKNR
jgi:multidrug efflux pump subunit AcrB